MDDKDTRQTIQIYNKLGKQYLNDIEKLVPEERTKFIKKLKKGSRVLDVGCAGGRDTEAFIEAGFKAIGIDLSEVLLKEAMKRVPSAQFIKMDARKLIFPDNSFDALWVNAVILHIKRSEIQDTLKGFHRVLKPKGILHIRVREGSGSRYVRDQLSQNLFRLYTFFTREEIIELVRRVGFEILSIRKIADEAKRESLYWISVLAEVAAHTEK
ncbi:MAG: methyltransferase domain-containing protein [Parcubacteria group bacterium]